MKTIVKLSLGLFVAMALAAVANVPTDPASTATLLAPGERHAKVSIIVTRLLENHHYRQAKVDDKLSSAIFDRYLEALDGNRQYFVAADIAEFEHYRFALDDGVRKGRLAPAFEIFGRYQQRYRERMHYSLELLQVEPDFSTAETFVFDRSELPWADDTATLEEFWRMKVKNDALSLILAGKEWPEAVEVLEKRYQRVLKRIDQISSDEVFESFMNAYAHTLDPHSSYFSPRNSEEYQIQMSLSYDGIGASLQLTDDFVTVLDIIPGGPAAIDGTLEPNDRITAVGQGGEGEMVDVVGWRLDDVVQLIRGPGGTVVRLQILPSGAAPGSQENLLPLTRDKIKLEAQAAQKDTLKIHRGLEELTVGVIEIPSFYQDYNARQAGNKDYTSTTRDVRRLIQELTDEGLDGLIVDLRGNGGGHLSEATELSGLFIDNGPIVQLRDTGGKVKVLDDPSPVAVYDGPLAVLVNRYSASASEIFAAAIQDYQRGVVLGQQTFGKGSVQNLYQLDRFERGRDSGFGQLTLTIGKYYRVTGGSTQHRGVHPDIALPSPVDSDEVGESTRDSALPWDHIKATNFATENEAPVAISDLQLAQERRAALDPDYQQLVTDIEAHETLRSRKSVSLNLDERRQEREESRLELLERENTRRAAQGLEILTSVDDLNDIEPPDVVLGQAAEIVADMISLGGQHEAGTTASVAK